VAEIAIKKAGTCSDRPQKTGCKLGWLDQRNPNQTVNRIAQWLLLVSVGGRSTHLENGSPSKGCTPVSG
jgi:hypothetical protein